jgi:hypothetical protein
MFEGFDSTYDYSLLGIGENAIKVIYGGKLRFCTLCQLRVPDSMYRRYRNSPDVYTLYTVFVLIPSDILVWEYTLSPEYG